MHICQNKAQAFTRKKEVSAVPLCPSLAHGSARRGLFLCIGTLPSVGKSNQDDSTTAVGDKQQYR